MSLRHAGPSEVMTPSVSIYHGNPGTIWGGVEQTFTGAEANNFGFVPKFMVVTGQSSWRGYEDFTGNSVCFTGTDILHDFDLSGMEIRSFVQGC